MAPACYRLGKLLLVSVVVLLVGGGGAFAEGASNGNTIVSPAVAFVGVGGYKNELPPFADRRWAMNHRRCEETTITRKTNVPFHDSPGRSRTARPQSRRERYSDQQPPPLPQRRPLPNPPTSNATTINHHVEHANTKAPMYITIGPPCAGKTTLLQHLPQPPSGQLRRHVYDIAIDDQLDVYVPVPTTLFLFEPRHPHNNNCDPSTTRLLNRIVQRKTLGSRIYDDSNDEMRAVLQRLDQLLSKEEFVERIATLYSSNRTAHVTRNNDNDAAAANESLQQVAKELTSAVEELIVATTAQPKLVLPDLVQLFVLENIFRPHPRTKRSAVEQAHAELARRSHQPQQPQANSNNQRNTSTLLTDGVAWGNTNTRPRDYTEALAIAAQSQRAVHFIVYSNIRTSDGTDTESTIHSSHESKDDDDDISSSSMILPELGLKVLIQRNLQRLLNEGKYVPAKAIYDASQRVERLVHRAVEHLQQEGPEQPAHMPQTKHGASTSLATNSSIPPPPPLTNVNMSSSFTKWDLDATLAKFSNFKMNPDRTVEKMSSPLERESKQTNKGKRRDARRSNTTHNNNNNNKNTNQRNNQASQQRQQQGGRTPYISNHRGSNVNKSEGNFTRSDKNNNK